MITTKPKTRKEKLELWQKNIHQRIEEQEQRLRDLRIEYLITISLFAILILISWIVQYMR